MKPVVAHYHRTFFIRSETFIYNLITALKRYDAVCLARSFEHLDAFPFPAANRLRLPDTEQGIVAKLLRRLAGSDREAVNFLRRTRSRLVHAHFGPNGVVALPLARRSGLPLVTTFYGYDASMLARDPEWKARYKKLFVEGDLFLVEGPCMESKLKMLGCPPEKIRIQRIAVPITRIAFRKRAASLSTAILIFTGRFVEKKGLIPALVALAALRQKRQDFEFRIIGDGELRPEIETYIRRHDMGGYVKLLGFLDYDEYLREMSAADIFLHPSVTAANGDDEGGAPTTILEAQAMGMPVLATYHADIPNIVHDGKSALLSVERDPDGLARNLSRLLDERGSWAAMGAAGRAFVETHHDLPAGVERLESAYDEILERKRV